MKEKLLDLKEKIDAKKTRLANLQGQVDASKKRLKEEFGCKSLADAKKKLVDMQREREKLEEALTKKVYAFQKEYAELLSD